MSHYVSLLKVPAHKPLARCLVEMAADAIRERAQQRQVKITLHDIIYLL